MTLEEQNILGEIKAGIGRLEGRLDEIRDAHQRQLDNVHGRIRGCKEEHHLDIQRLDGRIDREIHRPAMISGGGAGGVVSIIVVAVKHFFGVGSS